MSKLLRKLFIKDYKNVNDPIVRRKHGFLASCFGAVTNALLFGFKLAIGILSSSISIVSDAINNLTDMSSSIINFVGFKLSGKPADKKHPFGHERIEYIAAIIISFIITALAIVLGYGSIKKIINNENAEISIWVFIVLGAAILVKIYQYFFYKSIGKTIDSISLKVSAQDSLNDVISTSGVLLFSIIQFTLTKNNVVIPFSLDGVIGLCMSLFVIYIGIKMIIEASNPLIGITPDHELIKKVVEDIIAYDGVLGVHDLMCHCYGPTKIFMTLHVEVDCRTNINASHDLIDNIESDISKKHNILLTIHMDPIDNFSPKVIEIRKQVTDILKSYSTCLTFHDFRIVDGDTHTNILFDVLIPYENKMDQEDFKNYVSKEIKELNPKYNLVLKIDRDYISGEKTK